MKSIEQRVNLVKNTFALKDNKYDEIIKSLEFALTVDLEEELELYKKAFDMTISSLFLNPTISIKEAVREEYLNMAKQSIESEKNNGKRKC